jgi:hypothetical protein
MVNIAPRRATNPVERVPVMPIAAAGLSAMEGIAFILAIRPGEPVLLLPIAAVGSFVTMGIARHHVGCTQKPASSMTIVATG